MAYLGLVTSEHSSGPKQTRGGITKTGNGHVRRLLVEAAWTYRHPARKSALLQRRAERTGEAVQDIAWKAQKRLCHRYRHLLSRGKQTVHQPQRAAAMPRSAEYLQILRRCGISAVLSGAGPAVIAMTTQPELPAEAVEFGTANGFTVKEMSVGEGVRPPL